MSTLGLPGVEKRQVEPVSSDGSSSRQKLSSVHKPGSKLRFMLASGSKTLGKGSKSPHSWFKGSSPLAKNSSKNSSSADSRSAGTGSKMTSSKSTGSKGPGTSSKSDGGTPRRVPASGASRSIAVPRTPEYPVILSDNTSDLWVDTAQADLIFSVAIVVSAFLTGLEVDSTVRKTQSKEVDLFIWISQVLCVLIFNLELVLHVWASGWRYILPCNPSGCFDAVVLLGYIIDLCISFVDIHTGVTGASGALRVLKLLRLVRIFRVLLVIKELRLILTGLWSSISAVIWAAVLIGLLAYIGALSCVILLASISDAPDIEQYFGSVPMALFTHFELVTLEAWPDISDAVMDASGVSFWAVYFIFFILTTSLALTNLVTGIVCERLISSKERGREIDKFAVYEDKVLEFRASLEDILLKVDMNRYSTITSAEFTTLLESPDMQKFLVHEGVSLEFDSVAMFEMLDVDGLGSMSLNELAEALLHLRGSGKRPHSIVLHHDVTRLQKSHLARVQSIEERTEQEVGAEHAKSDEDIKSSLSTVEDEIGRIKSCLDGKLQKDLASAQDISQNEDTFDNPAFTAKLTTRFKALILELDTHCADATELLSAKKSITVKAATQSKEVQTHATIDYPESFGLQTLPDALLTI